MNVLERLKAIAALPFSRKVVLAVIAGLIAWLNARLGWGLPPEAVIGIVAVVGAVILGIAVEDAAKALRPPPTPDAPSPTEEGKP